MPHRTPVARPLRAAWVGVVAGCAGLAAAEVVAAFVGDNASPLVAVGATVVDATPPWLKDWAVRNLGSSDKSVLLGVVAMVVLLLAAVAGVQEVRRPRGGVPLVVVLCAAACLAAVNRPGAGPWVLLPAVAALAVGGWTLVTLARRARELPSRDAARADEAAGNDRRAFLRHTGAGLAGALVVGGLGRAFGSQRVDVAASRAAVRLPTPLSPAPAAPVAAAAPGATPFVTPLSDFYRVDTALVVPRVRAEDWTLRITGEVARPLTLTFDQLLARPMVERWVTLTCVSNEVGGDLAGTARWLGAPLADLLREAGPLDGADMVLSRSKDGMTIGTPLAALLDGRDALLAVGMDGAPLPLERGFPVRMVVPGLYGYVSATKWVVELEVTRFSDATAYWSSRGWSEQAPVKTASRIDVPRSRASAGRVQVGGVAWAQHRGVSKVEVRVDGGDWAQAELLPVPSADTWRQWRWEWDATEGEHELEVRATDGTGAVQTARRAAPAPDGATGYDSRTVRVSGART
ncbi:DMSO/TMAO reductase YedYZ molybdopterin-dependent catalytic subunit [Motilibacter peucedani]|uniref:DMSO/TMAO reductase YedYZ molybdopterin-dependent catalytic subunit n=1 Tax=Motilibacter peucedani TaxID=598650 RepID=A0A420XVP9_9ACTN|nr:molybdopterin-dependent oxidoreductase [Motilibacter peucedani]RKS84273.1 DMSO/TMAO reductase YedYZ molybdopterin-dependent catalytic subunit [Motilibacter peucedani]